MDEKDYGIVETPIVTTESKVDKNVIQLINTLNCLRKNTEKEKIETCVFNGKVIDTYEYYRLSDSDKAKTKIELRSGALAINTELVDESLEMLNKISKDKEKYGDIISYFPRINKILNLYGECKRMFAIMWVGALAKDMLILANYKVSAIDLGVLSKEDTDKLQKHRSNVNIREFKIADCFNKDFKARHNFKKSKNGYMECPF